MKLFIKSFFKKHGLFVALSAAFFIYFLGNTAINCNSIRFNPSGDGLKDYYVMQYHIQHDSTYWHTMAMNYPYGETVFFAGPQPLLTNAIKLISAIFPLVNNYSIGIHNILLLLSVLLAFLLTYLLFIRNRIPNFWASFLSIAIISMSQQWDRFMGHFSLSYLFVIPLCLLFIQIFYEKGVTLKRSVYFGFFMLWALFTQFYFVFMIVVILGVFWLFEIKKYRYKSILFLSVQFIIPYIIISSVMFFTEFAYDRTSLPWGFFENKATPMSVFLPLGKTYGQWIFSMFKSVDAPWEGWSFIGIIGVVFFLIQLTDIIYYVFKRRHFIQYTPISVLLFCSGYLLLLISFGIPFISFKELLLYTGPFKQLRGVGRLAWAFFYIINIYGVVLLFKWIQNSLIAKIFQLILLSIISIVMVFEGYSNASSRAPMMQNYPKPIKIPYINYSNYQAFVVFPYFHIGTENWGIQNAGNTLEIASEIGIKSGLSSFNNMGSRSPIKISASIISQFKYPFAPFLDSNLIKNKPILIAVDKNSALNEYELYLISLSKRFIENQEICFYTLDARVFKNIAKLHSLKIFKDFSVCDTAYLPKDSYYRDLTEKAFNLTKDFCGFNAVYPKTPNKLFVRFWISKPYVDLVPRTNVHITFFDNSGKTINESYLSLQNNYLVFSKDKALINIDLDSLPSAKMVKVEFYNSEIRNYQLIVSNILIAPKDYILIENFGCTTWVNNVPYKKTLLDTESPFCFLKQK